MVRVRGACRRGSWGLRRLQGRSALPCSKQAGTYSTTAITAHSLVTATRNCQSLTVMSVVVMSWQMMYATVLCTRDTVGWNGKKQKAKRARQTNLLERIAWCLHQSPSAQGPPGDLSRSLSWHLPEKQRPLAPRRHEPTDASGLVLQLLLQPHPCPLHLLHWCDVLLRLRPV